MTCARGSTSHSTRKASSSASCAARTLRRPRRWRLRQARYCGLALASAPASTWAPIWPSTFDMDFELLPERVEVAVELGRVAGGEWGRARSIGGGEADRMLGFHLPGPARQHD